MTASYAITALIAIGMVGVCIKMDKKRNLWLLLVFVSVAVHHMGCCMLAISKDLGNALNAYRLTVLGNVMLPFFLTMLMHRYCGMKRNGRIAGWLDSLTLVVLIIATTPGILPIYYSSVDIAQANGGTILVKENGPLYILYDIYLLVYLVYNLCLVIYTDRKKNIGYGMHKVLMGVIVCNIILWVVEQALGSKFEWLTISYLLTECQALYIYCVMESKGTGALDERRRSYTINVLLAVFFLMLANFIRVFTQNSAPLVYHTGQMAVLMIYNAILVAWADTAYQRILSRRVRSYLMGIAILMMIWLLMRTLRLTVFYRIFPYGQWCWYAIYFCTILIAQLCAFAAMYLGKPENYRMPRKWYLMYIPSGMLILGILTNDLHQLAFRFPMGREQGWEVFERSYLYYGAVVWISVCVLMMLIQMFRVCRIPGSRRMIWMPVIMLSMGILYSILHTLHSEMLGFIESVAALCFTVIAIWESSIKRGLIQSNTHYNEMLKTSGLGVAVVDTDYNVYYRSEDSLPVTEEQMRQTETEPLMLEGGIRLSGARIRGGYTLWQEDLSEMLGVIQELKELQEELQDSNTVSMQNYRMDRHLRAVAEKNRLHDELYRQTSKQVDLLNGWLKQLTMTEDPCQKRELLRRIVVVGAYLKRRNNLILVYEQDGMIEGEELILTLREMIRNLQLAGIHCGCTVDIQEDLPAHVAMKFFDVYEYVVEIVFDSLQAMLARFFRRDDYFYACFDVICGVDLTQYQTEELAVSVQDEGYYTVSFRMKGGEGR